MTIITSASADSPRMEDTGAKNGDDPPTTVINVNILVQLLAKYETESIKQSKAPLF